RIGVAETIGEGIEISLARLGKKCGRIAFKIAIGRRRDRTDRLICGRRRGRGDDQRGQQTQLFHLPPPSMKKARRVFRRAFVPCLCRCAYSRLPSRLSKKVNMLTKSR